MSSLVHFRGLVRLATRNVSRVTIVPRQNVAATSMIRQYHAFRPSTTAWKKKRMIIDEDDEELAAELAELEREKWGAEGPGSASQDGGAKSTLDSTNNEEAFQQLRDSILNKTRPELGQHELPRHTQLYHLLRMIQTPEQAQDLPQVVAQWRAKQLPLTILLSNRIIKTCVVQGQPELALEMLGDREKYGLHPGQVVIRKICKAFAKSVVPGAGEDGAESNESLEKLDNAYKILALIPHYETLMSGDAGLYAPLIRGSLAYGGEEGFRRAHITFEEFSLLDAERAQDEKLPSSIAAQLVGAAKEMQKAYEARPEHAENAKKTAELIKAWSKFIKA